MKDKVPRERPILIVRALFDPETGALYLCQGKLKRGSYLFYGGELVRVTCIRKEVVYTTNGKWKRSIIESMPMYVKK